MAKMAASDSNTRQTLFMRRGQDAARHKLPENLRRTAPPAASASSSKLNGSSSPQRKVRTVPPSARFDPPTPPSPPHPTSSANATTNTGEGNVAPRPKRRYRIRYSSSEDDETSASDDSEEETPWWTFTSTGGQRLRRAALRVNPARHGENGMAGETSKVKERVMENGRDGRVKRPMALRRSTRDSNERSTASSSRASLKNMTRRNSPSKSSSTNTKPNVPRPPGTVLLHPSPLRNPSQHHMFRKSFGLEPPNPLEAPVNQVTPKRSNSAPISPSNEIPITPIDVLAGVTASSSVPLAIARRRSPLKHNSASDTGDESSAQISKPRTKRLATAPSFPHFLRHREGALTDSETSMTNSPRGRVNYKRTSKLGNAPVEGEEYFSRPKVNTEGSASTVQDETPTRHRNLRANTSRLRLVIPPLQQRLSHWQQPGSWVDHMYEDYEEADRTKGGSKSNSGDGKEPNLGDQDETLVDRPKAVRPNSMDGLKTPITIGSGMDTPSRPSTPLTSSPAKRASSIDEGQSDKQIKPKTRTRRQRRFRQALVPPTPSGLGFIPTDRRGDDYGGWKEGKLDSNTNGFDWTGAGQNRSSSPIPMDRDAGDSLTQFGSAGTNAEKAGHTQVRGQNKKANDRSARPWWRFFGRKKTPSQLAAQKRFKEDLSWKEKGRIRLFSDVRVTIYLRLLNLAVTVCLLALAVVIRKELYEISYPGLIGPSTTIIIAAASFTITHILTAIYREYKGRPIGLWDLRSKMLWVCMDLLFIAIWSSALSLAVNDYIATSLNCTPLAPWWRSSQVTDLLRPSDLSGTALSGAICGRQVGCFTLSLVALVLYILNMVLSLFRIFETVRRSAEGGPGHLV